MEKDIEWQWNPEQQRSFISLKELIIKAPVLKYFNLKRPVKLSVDASSKGLGAVLLQDNRPIAYVTPLPMHLKLSQHANKNMSKLECT